MEKESNGLFTMEDVIEEKEVKDWRKKNKYTVDNNAQEYAMNYKKRGLFLSILKDDEEDKEDDVQN